MQVDNHSLRTKGYYVRGDTIYVRGVMDEVFYRRSTGLTATKKNLQHVAKKHQSILYKIISQETIVRNRLEVFGLEVINSGKNTREEETTKELISKFKRQIVPHFKHLDFEEITPLKIEAWQNYLLGRYSVATARKYINLLKRIMRKAVANKLTSSNPFDVVDSIKNKSTKPRDIYTKEEMKKILRGADGWVKVFLALAFSTGMRTGELISLRWEDFDFEARKIHVKHNMRKGHLKTTKTGNSRHVDILESVLEGVLFLYENKTHDEWVFPTRYGKPFGESKNFLKYHFKPLLEKVDVEYKTLYVTRHCFTTFMLSGGMDLLWVQNTLGHSTPETTLKFYSRYQEDTNNERAIKANKIFKNGANINTVVTQAKVM